MVVIVVVVLLLAVGGYYFMNGSLPYSDSSTTQEDDTMMKDDSMEKMMMLKENPDVLMAELQDVSGGTSTGTAYILRENGKLTHHVMATLPKPEAGTFYEGWLVQKSPLKFFSTGEMVMGEDGTYSLEYMSDQEYPTYDLVVITLETTRDDTPEEHILEGTPI